MARTCIPAPLGALLVLALVVPLTGGPRAAATEPAAGVAILREVRAASHPGFDRIVFAFSGRIPELRAIGWSDALWHDAAGPERRARIAGNTFLGLSFFPAWGIDIGEGCCAPSYGPRRRALATADLVELLEIGDWEGYLSFGIGLLRRTRIVAVTTLHDPPRIAIDIATGFARTTAPIAAWDTGADVWVARDRVIRADRGPLGTARDLLARMLAGPTPAERAAGLRLPRNGVTHITDLALEDGVLRLRLRGGCTAGTPGGTIGDAILRTVGDLPGIRAVKVFGPGGGTRVPSGAVDSLPVCLGPLPGG
ncbi:MAG: hypothetical protein ACKOTZ_10810 [Chloroflexota bacterium]